MSSADSITILLRNDQTHATEPFLGNRVQKIVSLTAAAASVAFTLALREQGLHTAEAIFDGRVFLVPPSEVNNVFLWRQKDCFRNCVSSYAYFKIAEKVGRKTARRMLEGVSTKGRNQLVFRELGVNINELPARWRRGRAFRRVVRSIPLADVVPAEKLAHLVARGHAAADDSVLRSRWEMDADLPLFNQRPEYIEGLMSSPARTAA
jgi:tRNA(His) guanylyltransferase